MNKEGTEIHPEGMLNINAGLIMTTCFLFARAQREDAGHHQHGAWARCSQRWRSSSPGTRRSAVAVVAIAVFSVGEMLSSPKFSEFIGNFAPADKKAMYLGFSQMPLAIGWTIEGKIGPALYDALGSKEVFARQMLAEKGFPSDLAAVPQGKAFDKLVEALHQPAWDVTRMLYGLHQASIASVWYIMGAVGIVSALGIWLYGRWLQRSAPAPRDAGRRRPGMPRPGDRGPIRAFTYRPPPEGGVVYGRPRGRRWTRTRRRRGATGAPRCGRPHRRGHRTRWRPTRPPPSPRPRASQPRTVGGHTARLVVAGRKPARFRFARIQLQPRARSPPAPGTAPKPRPLHHDGGHPAPPAAPPEEAALFRDSPEREEPAQKAGQVGGHPQAPGGRRRPAPTVDMEPVPPPGGQARGRRPSRRKGGRAWPSPPSPPGPATTSPAPSRSSSPLRRSPWGSSSSPWAA